MSPETNNNQYLDAARDVAMAAGYEADKLARGHAQDEDLRENLGTKMRMLTEGIGDDRLVIESTRLLNGKGAVPMKELTHIHSLLTGLLNDRRGATDHAQATIEEPDQPDMAA